MAVALVALSHAGVPFLHGGYVGVDVFFVLSGFLITGLLVDEARRRHHVSLPGFYLRRARRILPAALLTLLVTDIAAYKLLNMVRAQQYLRDSIPSALFGANIHFAAIGTDYFAQGQPPSPLQHYWSLSVEEQFYFVWPALFILVLGLSFRRYAPRPGILRDRMFLRLTIVTLVLGVVSLYWSIHATASNPAATYFSTPARVWELALGASLALAAPKIAPLTLRFAPLLGWLGLCLIVVASVGYSAATGFPGYAALLPVLGAGLVIVAGMRARPGRASAGRVLGLAPFQYVGDRSYAFYLWHWPVLVIAAQYAGHRLSVGTNLLLLAGALALSAVSYKLYENPIRHAQFTRRPQFAYVWPCALLLVIALPSAWISSIQSRITQQSDAAASAQVAVLANSPASAALPATAPQATGIPDAAAYRSLPAVMQEVALEQHHRSMPAVLVPAVSSLLNDLPAGYPSSCISGTGTTRSRVCRLGASSSARTIVLFGDSHAQAWLPNLLEAGQRHGWSVIPLIKEGCSSSEWLGASGGRFCPAWFRWAIGQVRALRPAAVLLADNYSNPGPILDPDTLAGLDAAVRDFKRASARVVVVGDIPLRERQPVDCLLSGHATPARCADTRTGGEDTQTAQAADLAQAEHVGFVDTTGWFCYQERCPLVVGNVITYRDTGHVSATYAHALSAVFDAAVSAAIARHS